MNNFEGKSVILFDGVCNLCNSSINFIIKKEMNDKFKVKIDTNDSRYVKLRKSFKDDISQKLECEDYDKVIE